MDIPSSFPPPGTPLPVPPVIKEVMPDQEAKPAKQDFPPMYSPSYTPTQTNGTAASVPLSPVSKPTEGRYIVMRANCTGDKVFLLVKGKRSWITSPEKLTELGYSFADVVRVPDDEILFYPEGETI